MSSPPFQPSPPLWTPPSSAPAGKYHIVKPLKIGGTAAIYLAVMRGENNFSREVVIKRPLPHLVAEPRSRNMFIDEAHIASRLSHPNICQVLDLVARDDELYIVLEYLRGVDLREILKRCIQLGRLLPPEVAVWLAVEVAAGLGYAHFATSVDGRPLNLVHRDVSPKNIRITFEGSVKVIDFGIARAEHRITQTSAGTIKGTLGYMSPEQILGDDIDHRSDIFAFGIVLFQMLTLRNPFDGPTLKERVRKLTQAPIPSVREFNPALDDDIAGIVTKCLERDVDDRYHRMGEVQAALDQYLARLQVVSPRQRLIVFLKDIFPSFDEFDDDLKIALSEVSSFKGPIDASVRLRFPDDPPTEPMPSSGPGSTHPATAATHPANIPSPAPADDRVERPGSTRPIPRPVEGTSADSVPTVHPTHHASVRPTAPTAAGELPTEKASPNALDSAATRPPPEPRAWSDEGQGDTRPLTDFAAARGPTARSARDRLDVGAESKGRSGVSGSMIGLAAAVMVVAGLVTVLVWPRRDVAVEPIEEAPVEAPTADPARSAPTADPARSAPTADPARSAPTADPARSAPTADPARSAPTADPARSKGTSTARARTPRPARTGADQRAKSRSGRSPKADRPRARLLFQTGARLKKQGRREDAQLMYVLAYAYSGGRPDASIFLNLGLLHNEHGRDAQAKACLQGYLERRPSAPQAGRVRTLVSSFPPLPTVRCVDRAEVARARRAENRRGAEIQQWLDATLASRLR